MVELLADLSQITFFEPHIQPKNRIDNLLSVIKICIHAAKNIDHAGVIGNEGGDRR